MDQGGEWRASDTFVVRVFRGGSGGLTGLVQHVRTGERMPFRDLASLGDLLARLRAGAGAPAPAPEAGPSPERGAAPGGSDQAGESFTPERSGGG